MPTRPLDKILYRELSTVRAKEVIGIASPLLQELVNFSTNAFARCASSSRGKAHEDLAALILYLHVIEMTDAIEVLVSQSCPAPGQTLLRSSFEATLYIEYILEAESEYVKRSLAWLVEYVRNRLEAYRSFSPSAPPRRSVRRALEEHKSEAMQALEVPDPAGAIENLEGFLAQPHIQPVERLFDEHRGWKWYQIFDSSLCNLYELARHLRREAEYVVLYRQWSSISHAHDLSRFLGRSLDGEAGFKSLRDPGTMRIVTSHAASYMLRATRLILGRFRPGEDISGWYATEVGERYKLL
jgi:hypothetical protein